MRHAQAALAIRREFDYRIIAGDAHTALANAYPRGDDRTLAIRHAREAYAIHRTAGPDAAAPYWRDALRIFTKVGAPEADEVRVHVRPAPS